jgi:hypothetical protein
MVIFFTCKVLVLCLRSILLSFKSNQNPLAIHHSNEKPLGKKWIGKKFPYQKSLLQQVSFEKEGIQNYETEPET